MRRDWLTRFSVFAPYAWLVAFFLVPFLIVVKISLSQSAIAQPPYLPVFDIGEGWAAIKAAFAQLSLDNFTLLVSDNLYISSYLRSIVVAVTSTLILLLIGYPVAYGMARLPQRWQAIAMMLVIVPFWTSFLIRIYAWINILQHDGLLNQILLALHLVSAPVVWLSTDTAMYIGIVYSYLPFMILPLYATLARMDPSLLEAASDLGASPWQSFKHVVLPLIAPSLVGVGMFGFTLSWDEIARTSQAIGDVNTLPLELQGLTSTVTNPAIYALGTVTTVVSFAVMGGTLALMKLLRRGGR